MVVTTTTNSDEPIDEDLEALLYAQVYYGKEKEVELPNFPESEPTEPEENKEDQEGATSEGTVLKRHFNHKKRYYENNLIQEDKEKENTDSFSKETDTEFITQQNPNIENSIVPSTEESNISPEILEQSLSEDHILPPRKEQELDSTANQQVIKISTSSPKTNPLSKDSSTQFVTTVSTPSKSGHPQLLNNITINQYLFPPSFQERLKSSLENTPLSKKCKSDLNKLKKGCISEQDFFNNLKRRLKIQRQQQSKIRKAYLKRQQSIARSEVIYLSDSDSSDIEIVEVTNNSHDSENKSPSMKEKVEILLEESEDEVPEDDEIIYVAPPPVPVISIDTESESDSSSNEEVTSKHVTASTQTPIKANTSQTLPDSQQDIDETSDDFLQPKNTPDNFNFSLHGSDFQNSEFVRPANPSDIYETESSTSTSDFNRDSSRQFCNSVKTIVFNEVEFPNQDIFDESNLESFGEFITPRRADKVKGTEAPSSSVDKPSTFKGSKRVIPRTSSESSSESEYEGSIAHQNLPDLSPMVCTESSPKKGKAGKKNLNEQPKKKKGKIEEPRDYNTRSNKKKAKEKLADLNDGIFDETVAKEPTRKSKRKSVAALEEEIPRKKSKKKKNKSGNISVDDNEDILEASTSVSDRSASPRKNLKDNCLVTSSTPSKKKSIEEESDDTSKKKIKKNKKQAKNTDLEVAAPEQEVLTVEEKDTTEDSSKKKCKKKKTKELSSTKNSEDKNIVEEQLVEVLEETNQAVAKEQGNVANDSNRKKNKKRKQKESSESRVVSEASSTTNEENELTSRTEKEPNGNLNKSPGEQEILTQESNVLEQHDTSENNSSKKKNKRKKRASTDKRSSVEESNISGLENESTKEKGKEREKEKSQDEPLEEGELTEEVSCEDVIEVPQNPEEDVILIEKVIPVHTIDSSESEDEDILTIDDVWNDLELANISTNIAETKEKRVEVIDNREFDVDYVQSKMSDDPEKWKILPTDRYSLSITKKGPRCNRCRQFGHISVSCPNKPAEPICTLCGEPGHQEPRCPNKVCFTCGKPGSFSTVYCYMCARQRQFKCSMCFITGHKTEYCPDLWRRYYLTTTEGPLTVPKKNCPTLKPRSKQWCSGCASKGHLEFECDTYKWIREYPASSPQIFKYKDVYADERKEKPETPPPRSRPRLADNYYQKLVGFLKPSKPVDTRFDQMSPRQKTVMRCLNILDKNLEENDSQEKVREIGENREVTEKPTESLDDALENRGNQQMLESQPTGQSASEDQHIPGTGSVVFEPPASQSSQSPPYNQTNQEEISPPSGQRDRNKQKRNSPKHAKINPVSVLRPSGFTAYHSVLNPYSILGGPSVRPRQGLFNQVPEDVLAKQLKNLTSAVPNYQSLDQSNFHQNSNLQNLSDFHQYVAQGSSAESHPPESYQNIQGPYRDRDFLDRPHTITRDPLEDRERIDIRTPYYRLEDQEPFMEDRERQVPQNTHTTSNTNEDVVEPIIPQLNDGVEEPKPILENKDSSPVENRDKFSVEKSHIEEKEVLIKERTSVKSTHDIVKSFFSHISSGLNTVLIHRNPSKTIKIAGDVIKRFQYSPPKVLKEILSQELEELERLRDKDPNIYSQHLKTIVQLKKKERGSKSYILYLQNKIHSLYQQINMFLFGVHTLRAGQEHLNYLKSVSMNHIKQKTRWNLLKSYAYIFGGEHSDGNMYECCFNFLDPPCRKHSDTNINPIVMPYALKIFKDYLSKPNRKDSENLQSPKGHVELQINDHVPEKEMLTYGKPLESDIAGNLSIKNRESNELSESVKSREEIAECRGEDVDIFKGGDLRERLNRKNKEQKIFKISYINSIQIDEDTVKKFHRLPGNDIRQMIRLELQELDSLRHTDIIIYKRKLEEIERLKQTEVKTEPVEKNIYLLFKQINMFLYGVHQLCRGPESLLILESYLNEPNSYYKKYKNKQMALEAYTYIFGGAHPGFHFYAYYLNALSSASVNVPASKVLCEKVSLPAVDQRGHPDTVECSEVLNIPFINTNGPLEESSIADSIVTSNQISLQSPKVCFVENDSNCSALALSMPLEHQTQDFARQNAININLPTTQRERSVQISKSNVDKYIVQKFYHLPTVALKKMIGKDIGLLDKIPRDKNTYVRKLDNIDKLSEIQPKSASITTDLYNLHRDLNMYLFGAHGLHGKQHLINLKHFVTNSSITKASTAKRTTMLEGYGYIFGGKRENVNYRNCLNNITEI